MDINCYFSYRMSKTPETAVACIMSVEQPSKTIEVETLIDNDGHYVDGCLKLLTTWLADYEDGINGATEQIWIHLHFHRSALSLKKAFVRCKDTALLCKGYPLDQQKALTKQKLTYKNYTKPVSYWSQVELVKSLVKLQKVFLTCETDNAAHTTNAYLLACAALNDHKEKIARGGATILEFKNAKT